MNKSSISAPPDDDVPITGEDIESGRLVRRARGEDGRVLPGEAQVPVLVDVSIVADFKRRAGEDGYRRLINDILRMSLSRGS